MCRAHESGDVQAVRDLIAARPELEKQAPDRTWLHRAAAAGHTELINFWLERGWDIDCNLYENPRIDGVATPLHFAKNVATTRHLLSRGATVNVWTRYGGTPLHFAVIRAVEADQRGRRRPTPDAAADQICALLEAGVDSALTDFEGRTPLALAVSLRRKTAEKALREAGAPATGRRPPKLPAKAPRIDLRKDAGCLATALKKAIKRFAHRGSDLPLTGLFFAVSAVEGFVMIAFDTGGADNPWDASHSEYAKVEFPRWRDAYDLASGGGTVTGINGTELTWSCSVGDAQFEKSFFDACVAVLEEAQNEDAFAVLSRSPGFVVVVETTSGHHSKVWQSDNSGKTGGAT